MKNHQTHGLLIFGYDDARKIFSVLSYTNRGVYEEFEVSVCDVAIASVSPYFDEMHLLKRNDICPIIYNIHILRDRLNRYIYSILEDDHNLRYTKPDIGDYYNFNACEYFAVHYTIELWQKKTSIKHQFMDFRNINGVWHGGLTISVKLKVCV